MACSADSSIPLLSIPGVGSITASIETLTSALSLYAAYTFYDKWKDDADHLQDLADKYTTIGTDYCEKAGDFRANEVKVLGYALDVPDHAPEQHYASGACATIAADASLSLKRAYAAMPADAVGARCMVRTEVAKQVIRQGVVAKVDGVMRQQALDDRYKAARLKAYADTLSGAPPNLGSAFSLVADTVSQSAMSNSLAFNGAAYTAARSMGTMWQRFNGQIPSYSPSVGGMF